jgi:hypothetical protein
MTPSIRRTAIRKKASVVNIAATPAEMSFHMVGNGSLPPNLGGHTLKDFPHCLRTYFSYGFIGVLLTEAA